MVLQVDFYILHHQHYEPFICQLTEKIWRQGYRVYIYLNAQAQAQRLDDKLWTFKEEVFLPHEMGQQDALTPICLGYPQLNDHFDNSLEVLMNLTDDVPHFFKQFKRIAEVVEDTPKARQAGRERYRAYKSHLTELKIHDIYPHASQS